MKTPLLILAAVFLVGCETSTVEQPAPQPASIQPISQPVPVVETVYGKTIVETFTAKVVAITDGDTIKVLTADNEQIKIRIESIDCPESKQAFGTKAKQAMSALVFGKVVTILKTGEDRYGRTLAFVVADGVNTSQAMIKNGYAWHYKRYSADQTLAGLEAEARATKRGLWANVEPIAPWDWRAREKKN